MPPAIILVPKNEWSNEKIACCKNKWDKVKISDNLRHIPKSHKNNKIFSLFLNKKI